MKKYIFLSSIALAAFCTLFGCGSARHVTQLVHDIQRDTVYLSNVQYDSIYIYESHNRDYHPSLGTLELGTLKPDTVFVKDVSVEYRYKLLRDTVRIVQRDSIPYEVTIVETREIARPLTWFDKLTQACFFLVIVIVIVIVVRKFRRL